MNTIVNYMTTILAKVLNALVGLILLFVSNEFLGFEIRGQAGIILYWVSMVFTVSYLSLGQIGFKYIVIKGFNVQDVMKNLLIYNIIFLMLALLVTLFFKLFGYVFEVKMGTVFILIITIPLMMLEQQLNSIYLVKYAPLDLAKTVIKSKLTVLPISIGIFYMWPTVTGFFLSNLVMYLISVVYLYYSYNENIFFFWKKGGFFLFDLVKDGIKYHSFNALGYVLYMQFPMLYLGKIASNYSFSQYEIAMRFLAIFSIVATSCQVIITHVFKRVSNRLDIWNEIKKLSLIYFSVSYFFVFFSYLFVVFVSDFELGKKYELSILIFKELVWFVPFIGIAQFVPTIYLHLDRVNLSSIYNFLLGFFSLFTVIALGTIMGESGVVFAIKLTYIFSICLLFLMSYNSIFKRK